MSLLSGSRSSGISSNFWSCSGSKSLDSIRKQGLEQQVSSASLRTDLAKAVHSVTYESHNQNFNTVKIFVWNVQGAQIS